MIAVELRIRLEQAFGVAPKVVFLLQGANLDGVAEFIRGELTLGGRARCPRTWPSCLASWTPTPRKRCLPKSKAIERETSHD